MIISQVSSGGCIYGEMQNPIGDYKSTDPTVKDWGKTQAVIIPRAGSTNRGGRAEHSNQKPFAVGVGPSLLDFSSCRTLKFPWIREPWSSWPLHLLLLSIFALNLDDSTNLVEI